MAQSVFANPRPRYQKTDDPLADLAAITGYRDGRSGAAVDDFAIDLERELLGAFGRDNEVSEAENAALDSELENGFADTFGASEASAISDELNDEFASAFEASVADYANSNVAPAESLAYDDFVAGDEFDAAFDASEPEPELAAPPAFTAPPPAFDSASMDAEAAVDLDFGDFDPADFESAAPASVEATVAEDVVSAQDDFESELYARIEETDVDAPAWAPQAAEVAAGPFADFETELAASIATEPEQAVVAVAEEATVAPPADPFAELAALAASYKAVRPSVFSRAPSWTLRRVEPVETQPAAAMPQVTGFAPSAAPVFEDEPLSVDEMAAADYADDFGSIESTDEPVPVTDEFDLPDIDYADAPVASAYSDIDIDYAEASVPAAASMAHAEAPVRTEEALSDFFANEFGKEFEQSLSLDDEPAPVAATLPVEDEFDVPGPVLAVQPPRRGLFVAAGVAAIALLGGVAAFAFMGRDATPSQPAIVKADPDPVKVKPEKPGGAEIANQDKAVYDKVSGATSKSGQDKLVTTAEEPVNVDQVAADKAPAIAPVAKGEDRVMPTPDEEPANAGIAAVQPKKVKTLVVKPDGSLVARETPAAPAADTVTAAVDAKPVDGADASVTYQLPAAPVENATAEPAEPAAVPADPLKEAIAADAEPVKPAVVEKPKAEKKKPAETKKQTKTEQVAAVESAPAAGGGEWSIQIASQPTKDGAQASYKSLSGKFGSIIGGRGVSIVQADIPGKGTFYRVRVPAGSKSDANALCARYQAAGGSCFITR